MLRLVNVCFLLIFVNLADFNIKYDIDDDAQKLEDIQSEFWYWTQREFSTYQLYNFSRYDVRLARADELLTRVSEISSDGLSEIENDNKEILQTHLRTFVDGYQWREFGNLNPLYYLRHQNFPSPSFRGGISNSSLVKGRSWMTRRIDRFTRQVDGIIDLLTRAVRLRRTLHKYSMIGVVDQLKKLKNKYDRAYLVTTLKNNFMRSFLGRGRAERKAVDSAEVNKSALQASVRIKSVYLKLIRFLEETYMPNLRSCEGVVCWPGGLEYYQQVLKWHLSFDISAKEIHETGLKEVERIQRNMMKVIEGLNFTGSLQDFIQHLTTIKAFYNHTETDMLKEYERLLEKRINPKLLMMFHDYNVPTLQVLSTIRDTPSGYSQNRFFANVFLPRTKASFNMLPLTLHEGNPGHHFQLSFERKLPMLPDFRKRNIRGSWYHRAPFAFPRFTSFAEGWALYAEALGEEMEIFETPYELFGRYVSEMFRACRLVVDTGIHAFKWSKERATGYMMNHTALSKQKISMEVNRYITWPGQACAYKIGELFIWKLRRFAEKELGDAFDLKGFHEVILTTGRAPLDLLERKVHSWVEEKQRSAALSSSENGCVTMIVPWVCLLVCSFLSHYF